MGLMAKVARAVEYAHSEGILHRDLKPGNILLDGRGEPLVSDFGLAKWLDSDERAYAHADDFRTRRVTSRLNRRRDRLRKLTPAADIYSLGAILFNLLTGRPPFLGKHALAVIQQASRKARAETAFACAQRSIAIWKPFVRNVWSANRERAIASAGDLAEDLERWLAGHHGHYAALFRARAPLASGRGGIRLLREWQRSCWRWERQWA